MKHKCTKHLEVKCGMLSTACNPEWEHQKLVKTSNDISSLWLILKEHSVFSHNSSVAISIAMLVDQSIGPLKLDNYWMDCSELSFKFTSSTIIKLKIQLVQYFGLWMTCLQNLINCTVWHYHLAHSTTLDILILHPVSHLSRFLLIVCRLFREPSGVIIIREQSVSIITDHRHKLKL